MKNKRFEDWIVTVGSLVKKRLSGVKHVSTDTWVTYSQGGVYTVHTRFSNGLSFSMSFHKIEHERNNSSGRKRLAMHRRKDMACEMRDFAEELTKVAKALEK